MIPVAAPATMPSPGQRGRPVRRPPAARSFRCCGVRVDALDLDGATDEVLRAAGAGRALRVHLCNAYTLSLAHRDPSLRHALNGGDLNLPDGTPLVWIGRRLGFAEMVRRVYGPDLMRTVIDRGRAQGVRHYLYGSTPAVLRRLAASLEKAYPGADIVAAESPPFRPLRPEEGDAVTERVRAAGADLVWVGLGTPKQDRFVAEFGPRLATTLVAVGAAFDFLAGTTPQAPRLLRDHGLEWAYRLVREPRRLWRRYLVGNVVFLAGVAIRGVAVDDGAPSARP
ncbi:MAG: WecB/TagA/CpsF family glycosyltransferase [Actinobacteria bacterium]|nr:WecB/TagA/CpsF family glycosyltransferase [Actinomycetota bacterium]